jgi:hypothetical protein
MSLSEREGGEVVEREEVQKEDEDREKLWWYIAFWTITRWSVVGK